MLLRAIHLPTAAIHGFSTRHGGVSSGRYATMNLGQRWGDDPLAVAENLRRLAAQAGFEPEHLRRVTQVHGALAVAARDITAQTEADAVWHHRDQGPWVVGVMTADCVPILLVDRDARVCAAIHSGWRGTVAAIVQHTIETIERATGIGPDRLCAAIGPCIEVDAFEVGEEVADQFDPAFVRRSAGAKPHVDLVAVVRNQLRQAGVVQIEKVGGCTHADPDNHFSFRRDGANQGQHLSFIGLR